MVATVPAQTTEVRKLGVVQGAQVRNLSAPILADKHGASATGTQP
jgi:mRNA-degrading endonuclease toxin of MazEF toxin-antitoxin module